MQTCHGLTLSYYSHSDDIVFFQNNVSFYFCLIRKNHLHNNTNKKMAKGRLLPPGFGLGCGGPTIVLSSSPKEITQFPITLYQKFQL